MTDRRAALTALVAEYPGTDVAELMERAAASGLLPLDALDHPRRFVCAACELPTISLGQIVALDSENYAVPATRSTDSRMLVGFANGFPGRGTVAVGPTFRTSDTNELATRPCPVCNNTRLLQYPPSVEAFIAWAALGFDLAPTDIVNPFHGAFDIGQTLTLYHGFDGAERLAGELCRQFSEFEPAYAAVKTIAWRGAPLCATSFAAAEKLARVLVEDKTGITPITAATSLLLMGLSYRLDGETLVLPFPLNTPPSPPVQPA